MEQQVKEGVDVYRIRGFEFLLPKTYTEKNVIITMEYLNAKTDHLKGRLYAHYYGDYKPVLINEFMIEGIAPSAANSEIEDACYKYLVDGGDEYFKERIKLYLDHIDEPETKSEFEIKRYDINKERLGKVYGLFFYLPERMSAHNVEITLTYKKNKNGKLEVITYLMDKKIPYRVKLSSGTTGIDFSDPYRDSLVFDQFQYDKEVQGVLTSWDILRDHMK